MILGMAKGQTQTDSTHSNNNDVGFGGPKNVGAQLQIDMRRSLITPSPGELADVHFQCNTKI